MISYSQNFEDVMLWRALGQISHGFYIDVGAHDSESGSVTKTFYDNGWRGINIEPLPVQFSKLESNRSRDINLQVCAGSYDGTVDFYDVEPSGLATIKQNIAKKYIEDGYKVTHHNIRIEKLASICQRHVQGDIHFLKIDVEGAEKDVLLGADFELFRPWIVIIEATYPNSNIATHSEWEDIMTGSGYEFAYFDGLNRFYVANEMNHLVNHFKIPPNFFDSFTLSLTSFFVRDIAAELEALKAKTQEAETITEKLKRAKESVKKGEARIRELEINNEFVSVEVTTLKAKTQEAETITEKLGETLSIIRNERDAHKNHELLLNAKLKRAEENEREGAARIKELETDNKSLQNRLNSANEKIDAESETTHYWWSVAEERNRQLTEAHDSWSWHITRPLRKAFDIFIKAYRLLSTLKIKSIRLITNVARYLLVMAITFVLNRKGLKSLSMYYLDKFPRLASHIKTFATSEGVLQSNINIHMQTNNEEAIHNLTPRELEIFLDLKTKITTRNKV